MSRLPAFTGTAPRSRERGQVIPLFALMLVALLGIAGLAIDVSRRYAEVRSDRSVADAAALAGAQDLQAGNSRTVGSAEQVRARGHALGSLASQLGAATPPICATSADIVDCPIPGTSYLVSIRTPAPSCVGTGTSICDSTHSVQVTVRQTGFQTSFARVFGQNQWDFRTTSVAGLSFNSKYAVITLQAPAPQNNGTDANLNKDLVVSGNGTVLNVLSGDVGTNTSATTTNTALITLASGFSIDHYDDLTVTLDTWTKVNGLPVGRQIPSKIQDPAYPYASFTGAPTFANQSDGVTPCTGASFPTSYLVGSTNILSGAVCYRPGVYTDSHGFKVGTGEVAYLMPGAYRFPYGAVIRGSLLGGLISGSSGVVLSVPQRTDGSNVYIDANNSLRFLLNSGGSACSSDNCRATAAVDFAGHQVKTPQGLPLTIEIDRDGNCFNGTDPYNDAGSHGCNVSNNRTVNLAGSGSLAVGGVIYGPSDNMSINGNSGQTGYVGQIVSWSVTYTGGSVLNQSYPGGIGTGVLRVDPACSAPGEPCVNP